MTLSEQIHAALAAGDATTLPALQALYQQCYGETCRRRNRILYRLQTYLNRNPTPQSQPVMPKAASQYRLKAKYASKGPILETKEGTVRLTPHNLTDEYAELLRSSGRGHFLEESEAEQEEVVKKTKKGKKEDASEEAAEPAAEPSEEAAQ